MPERSCPRCGADNASAPALHSWREWRIRRCRGCRFVYLANPPAQAAYDVEYAWERNYDARERRMRDEHPIAFAISGWHRKVRRAVVRKPNKLSRRVEKWIPSGTVVELGCGSGGWLAALPSRYEVVGVEISEALAREAGAALRGRGGRVIHAPATEALRGFDPGAADGVLMRSFLEHEHEPAELLRLTARALRPGGVAVVKVPNYGTPNRWVMGRRWCGFRFPDHLNYFTAGSLRAMVEASGLDVAAAARWPVGDNMWMVAARR